MSGLQKALKKLILNQHEEVILNKDGLTVIIMKPNERFMLEFGRSIEESLTLLRNLKEKENVEKFMSIVESLLTETIRHPDDYKAKLIVPDDKEPLEYQETFSDFNPSIDNEVLLAQKKITPYEFEIDALGSGAGKTAIFLLVLRMLGILRPQYEAPPKKEEKPEEEEENKKKQEEDPEKKAIVDNFSQVESFPGNNENSEKTDINGTV